MHEAAPTPEVVAWDDLRGLDGQPFDSEQLAGKAVLVVNVASKCGLTPQYEGLERLQRAYGDRGFTVLGVPCNQFAGQEPGTPDEIEGFCRTTYGTTFPMTAKLEGQWSAPPPAVSAADRGYGRGRGGRRDRVELREVPCRAVR